VSAGDQTTNPAADGTYSLTLNPGTYTVPFTLDLYQDIVVPNIVVAAGAYTQVNATLNWLPCGVQWHGHAQRRLRRRDAGGGGSRNGNHNPCRRRKLHTHS
jgi:hypothetical protein